jgi:hypothetical protein
VSTGRAVTLGISRSPKCQPTQQGGVQPNSLSRIVGLVASNEDLPVLDSCCESDVESVSDSEEEPPRKKPKQGQRSTDAGQLTGFFNPLAEASPDNVGLSQQQVLFLQTYFTDPDYLPGVLGRIVEEHPAPAVVKDGVTRRLDGTLCSLMGSDKASVARDVDKNFTAIGARLEAAMGPLADLWVQARQGDDSLPSSTVATLLEKAFVCLGQVNASILFQRRRNFLGKFLNDHKRAHMVVTQNHAVLTEQAVDLFGPTFQHELYRESKKLQQLKTVKAEFSRPSSKEKHRASAKPKQQKQRPQYQAPQYRSPLQRGDAPAATVTSAGPPKPFHRGPSTRGRGGGQKAPNRYSAFHRRFASSRSTFSFVRRRRPFSRVVGAGTTRPFGGSRGGQSFSPCKELGKSLGGCVDPQSSSGSSHEPVTITGSDKGPTQPNFPSRHQDGLRCGSSQSAAETSDRGSDSVPRPICELHLPSVEERRVSSTRIQPERVKCIRTLRAFQDGGPTHGTGYGDAFELVHETGPQRPLLRTSGGISCVFTGGRQGIDSRHAPSV